MLWDLDSCAFVWEQRSLTYLIFQVAFSPLSNLVALRGGSIALLDATSGQIIWQHHLGVRMLDVAWATDGTRLLTRNDGGAVFLWDVASAISTKGVDLLIEYDIFRSAPSSMAIDLLPQTTVSSPYPSSIGLHVPQMT